MSRGSDLRDAIATRLQTLLGSSYTVEAIAGTNYEKSDLSTGPRIFVQLNNREFALQQGPNITAPIIAVGVAGIATDRSGDASGTDPQAARLAKVDSYDAIMETLIGYWMDDTKMNCGIAEHFPNNIDQGMHYVPEKLHGDDVYMSFVRITYHDQEDE